ncbi:MAG: choice-of-anchor J domain-containing protein, partial [Bacteroidetes bacterium]|nr:choice-of-anchor J domain-containing protein [Bacteroidota bacterium]
WRSSTVAPFSPTTHAFVRYNPPASPPGSKFLVTKRLNIPSAANTYEITFWARRQFTSPFPPDTIYVKLSTTDSLPGSFGPAIYKCFTGDTASSPDVYGVNYRKFRATFTGIAGPLYVAFDHQDNDGQTVYLDDVTVQEATITQVHDIGVVALTGAPSSAPKVVANVPMESSKAIEAERAGKASGETHYYEGPGIELVPVYGFNAMAPVSFHARVRNFGQFVENAYQVGWSIDGVAQTPVSNTRPLEIGGFDTLMLTWANPTAGVHTARAWTILATDTNPSNDTSAPYIFDILPSNIIYEETFADTTIPAGWLVVNNDGSPAANSTWQFRQIVNFTGGGTVLPQAGASFWFASYTGANGFLIDEWLISPQIAAANFDSLFFYAGAIGGSFPDSLKVLVSTTGNNVGDFTHQLGYFRIPGPVGSWHRFGVNLSQFAGQNIYIAINYYIVNGGPNGDNSDNVWADHVIVTGTPIGFFDDFESYTVGQQLVAQNPTDWTTWSGPGGTAEDPFISSAQAFSGTKSVVIVTNNDLVKLLGNDTTGVHEISFRFFVPNTKAGYFNTLATFTPPSTFNWGMEAYFDSTGNGRLFAGSATAVPFTYTRNAWQEAKVVVNLTIDSARFVLNGNTIRTWRWTAGASGGTSPKRLAANDFFGATAWDQMYMDDYRYRPGTWTGVEEQPQPGIPETYALMQNYPNPFNPTTTIQYALPTASTVSLKIYNILGQEVATLVDQVQTAGYHTAVWNGRNQYGSQVATGVYFYRIEAKASDGSAPFTNLKKMLLVK